jgi:N-acylneuraminate cytidylyltransferase/CMP-N,N'-diacetyllegionaminic acid synthase
MISLGLIPARGGSTGIKRKNLQIINGKPLIVHTIKKALASSLDRVIVATDDEEIKKISLKAGAECPFIRPKNISKKHSHAFEIYKYTLQWLKKNENYCPDILCVMLCTTPFRKVETINDSLNKLKSNRYDWIFSVNEIEHHPYRAMLIKKKNLIKPMFDIPNNKIWVNRQEFSKVFRFNGGVIACLTKNITTNHEYNIDNLKYKNIRVGYSEMTKLESLDIDEKMDIEYARFLVKNKFIKI